MPARSLEPRPLAPCACVAPEPEPRLSLDADELPDDPAEGPELALLLIPEEPELPLPALPPEPELDVWASAAVPMRAAASPSAKVLMGVTSVPWER
jgi:hypothetical protein